MDYKFDLNFTGTATVVAITRRYFVAGATAGNSQENSLTQNTTLGVVNVTATSTGMARIEIEAVLDVSVSGSIQFRWAQNTSDASNLTVLRGSYLEHC
jgi:hypothetical protein